jgi:LacI family transcriptional regulator
MADMNTHHEDLTGRRRGWTPVLINLHDGGEDVIRHLVRLARQRQWQLISLSKFYGQLPDNLSARGAIVNKLPSDPAVRSLLDRGVPVVRVGFWPHPDDHLVPAVMPDRSAAGRLAAEHFAARDFKHVAFVGRKPWGAFESTYDSFRARAAELGCTCHLLRTELSASYEQGEVPEVSRWNKRLEVFTGWLKTLPMPVGLLAITDTYADRFSYGATEAGLRVPEDLAVMGIGNDEAVCECAPVPITSVAWDTDRIASTAVELLEQLMAGQAVAQSTVKIPPAGVITRPSTDVLAASDPFVVQALRYMWDHVADDLSVDQIAQHVGTSRRSLEKAFKNDLGRGINAEFQRRRLDRACELLLNTDLRIGEVAASLNFSSQKYFCEAFGKAYGVSPSDYRRQGRLARS